ncbi:MAG: yiaD [Ignavibacteria bacterium]|nr:yiaD [Ignavibacteria bacterium]
MRKIIYIFVLLFSGSAYGQSLSVFDIDPSGFPNIRAKFFAFDVIGYQLTNLSIPDFEVRENGELRQVIKVSCPGKKPAVISSVLVMDVSTSMCEDDNRLDLAKAAGNIWIDMLPFNESECAITSFSNYNYINQDFTTKRAKLQKGLHSLTCISGTNYNAALLDPAAGGIIIAKTGKYKRIIVFLTDGAPNFPPKTKEIIDSAKSNNITIYCVSIAMKAHQSMKDIAAQTGGLCFENIKTKEEIVDCYRKIYVMAQGGEPCEIEWLSENVCKTGNINTVITLLPIMRTVKTSYRLPANVQLLLEFEPPSVNFLNAQPGIEVDTVIKVTAINKDIQVSNIISSNPAFYFSPSSFTLSIGQSMDLKLSFVPVDSGYTYAKFNFENSICPVQYTASGGFTYKKPKIRTIKLIHPNGGEEFVVGSDTIITWDGVLKEEKVKIEYTINKGKDWIKIGDSLTGLIYYWHVPNTPSRECLARVTAKMPFSPICPGGDVNICKQIWMVCNLDVEYYRNGDRIKNCATNAEWSDANDRKEGAWCYYDNDPGNGPIYGKLYNWYAVIDPRGIAPIGWHIPTNKELLSLDTCLNDSLNGGGKLKTTGFFEDGEGLWKKPNTGATNKTGFSAIPAGYRSINGAFYDLGLSGNWWTSTEFNVLLACNFRLYYDISFFHKSIINKDYGYSVRCVSD